MNQKTAATKSKTKSRAPSFLGKVSNPPPLPPKTAIVAGGQLKRVLCADIKPSAASNRMAAAMAPRRPPAARWPSIYELQREEMAAQLAAERPPPAPAAPNVKIMDDLYPPCGMVASAERRGRPAAPSCGAPAGGGGGGGGGSAPAPDPASQERPAFPSAEAVHTLPAGSYRPGRGIDTHEMLKQLMFASSTPACDDHFQKNRPCPSTIYGVSDQFLVLDSFEKLRESPVEVGEFQFNFMVQGVTRNQNIGVRETLKTVIGIQCYEFSIPNLPLDNFDPAVATVLSPPLAALNLAENWSPAVLPNLPPQDAPLSSTGDWRTQLPYSNRITMFFKEIGLQSFSDTNNRRHHYEFKATPLPRVTTSLLAPSSDRLALAPIDQSSYYLFTEPIQAVHGLTLAFYTPGEPVKFPPDVLYGAAAATDAAGLLTFTFTDPTNLINLAPEDRIFVQGFEITTPGAPAAVLDRWVTRPEGQLVGAGGYAVDGPTSAASGTTVTFRLNPDVTVPGVPPNTALTSAKPIDVYIAKNRIRIPLRFRRIINRLTNYVSP